jgi:glutathione-independent formaldehyde dehydrogenase
VWRLNEGRLSTGFARCLRSARKQLAKILTGVKPGSTVYVAGAGPVGLAAAASAQLLGAAVIMIGDMNEARLSHAKKVGFVPIDLTKHDRLASRWPRSSANPP